MSEGLEAALLDHIRERRHELGLTQAQLAQRMTDLGWEVSQRWVSYIETGKRHLRLSEASMLMRAMGGRLEIHPENCDCQGCPQPKEAAR